MLCHRYIAVSAYLAASLGAGPLAAQDSASTNEMSAAAERAGLYPGESVEEAAGFPAITHFTAGEPDRPLVVFVPGAHHAARVAYGGHEGARKEDFLAHHLAERGYNVLAVSYPIGLEEGGLPTDHPGFTIRDWGAQVVELAQRTLEERELDGPVIVLGWSMGGKSAQPVFAAAQERGLDLDLFVSLAATPPLPGLIALTREYPMLESGYADRRGDFDRWHAQVAAGGEAQGREIVPEDVFKTQYQGDIPINLQGYGQRYRDGAFVMDPMADMEDAQPFAFDSYPLIAAIVPNGRADARHALTDRAAWGLYNANTLFNRHMADVDVDALSDEEWAALTALSDGLDDRLTRRVDGNHFFFMGEVGAEATAEAVAASRARRWRSRRSYRSCSAALSNKPIKATAAIGWRFRAPDLTPTLRQRHSPRGKGTAGSVRGASSPTRSREETR